MGNPLDHRLEAERLLDHIATQFNDQGIKAVSADLVALVALAHAVLAVR
jgi:hypothetical protein